MAISHLIEWKLDTEEELNGYDPVGEVQITGEEGFIKEEFTYLDAFFEALARGLTLMPENQKCSIDPMVEPDNINFEYVNYALKISYGEQTVFIHDLNRLKKELLQAVKSLLKQIDDLTDANNKERRQLEYLRQYIQK